MTDIIREHFYVTGSDYTAEHEKQKQSMESFTRLTLQPLKMMCLGSVLLWPNFSCFKHNEMKM